MVTVFGIQAGRDSISLIGSKGKKNIYLKARSSHMNRAGTPFFLNYSKKIVL